MFTANQLKKKSVQELAQIANVSGDNIPTKKELIKMIQEAQNTAKAEEKKKPEVETLNIRDCEVGDVIRYTSSKKPYIIAEKDLEAKRPFVFLFSATQQYNSYKEKFEVIRLAKGEGSLPESYGDETYDAVLAAARKALDTRAELRQAKIEAEEKCAAKKAEKEAAKAKVETPTPQPVEVEATDNSWELDKAAQEAAAIDMKS